MARLLRAIVLLAVSSHVFAAQWATHDGCDTAQLLSWALENGAWLSPGLSIQPSSGAGLGVFTDSLVGEGEPVLTVPKSMILYRARPERAAVDAEGASSGQAAPDLEPDQELALLVLKLALHERSTWGRPDASGGDSPSTWKPYLSCLPRMVEVPAVWNEAELSELQASTLLKEVRDANSSSFAPWYEELQDDLGGATFQQWLWALSIAWSRSHRHDILLTKQKGAAGGAAGPGEDGQAVPQLALLPISDFFNDAPWAEDANVRMVRLLDGAGELAAFSFRTTRMVPARSELRLSSFTGGYKARNVRHLLQHYGYVAEYGAADKTPIFLTAQDVLFARAAVEMRAGKTKEEVSTAAVSTAKELEALGLWRQPLTLTLQDVTGGGGGAAGSSAFGGVPPALLKIAEVVGGGREEGLELLRGYASRWLSAYGSSLDEDEARLSAVGEELGEQTLDGEEEHGPLLPRQRMALVLRLAEKRVLKGLLERIEARVEAERDELSLSYEDEE